MTTTIKPKDQTLALPARDVQRLARGQFLMISGDTTQALQLAANRLDQNPGSRLIIRVEG